MKNRHLKTIYERFSHFKVEDLEGLMSEINSQIKEFKIQEKIDHYRRHTPILYDISKIIDILNIPIAGKFYLYSRNSGKYGKSDAYNFTRNDWTEPRIKKYLENNENLFLRVIVLSSDFKGNSLVIYDDHTEPYYTLKIVNDKGEFPILLSGNIGHTV